MSGRLLFDSSGRFIAFWPHGVPFVWDCYGRVLGWSSERGSGCLLDDRGAYVASLFACDRLVILPNPPGRLIGRCPTVHPGPLEPPAWPPRRGVVAPPAGSRDLEIAPPRPDDLFRPALVSVQPGQTHKARISLIDEARITRGGRPA